MVSDYKKMAEKEAGYAFAEQAAAVAAPVLAKGFAADPLGKVKEIALATALSQMPQPTIQPALEAMVQCDRNSAVRYFGWKGYHDARLRILGQGLSATQTALASIEQAAKNETSPAVLEQLFRMMELDAVRPDRVTPETWDLAQKRILAAMNGNWIGWCRRAMAGPDESNELIAEACFWAVRAARSQVERAVQDKDQKKLILQMLVDMAYAAAKGYAQAAAAGRPTDAYASLLIACDEALNKAAGAKKDYIQKALNSKKLAGNPDVLLFGMDEDTKEPMGVLAWVEFLKDQGVVSPSRTLQPPTTASAPAGGAATRPAAVP